MNSRERMALVMRHQIPDRVPVMCQLALGLGQNLLERVGRIEQIAGIKAVEAAESTDRGIRMFHV